MDKKPFTLNALLKQSDLIIALALLGTLLMMILPMPAFIMDIFLVLSVTLSVAILLVSIYTQRPLDFSVFPTLLLFATLFRLSLNVASTRLVLLHGHEGTAAAGHVIETFGELVIGGSYIVGVVIFLLLVVINFVVITKGSGRVAEVAARFILDALPGKQMSIDADLNAGLITDDEARERRKRVEREADFYGAMDGASKFVRGDAIAGMLITAVNILGGFAIGVFQKDLSISQAAERYTLMTIGDGLVTQIPSLIISTAAGIIVTRAASGNDLSKEMTSQILLHPRAINITAGIIFLIGLMPHVPFTPFFVVSATLAGISYAIRQGQKREAEVKRLEEKKKSQKEEMETTEPPEVDTLELQVGYGLVNLVDPDQKGDLVDRVFQLRKEFAKELGIIVPKVRIKDNLELKPYSYSILIKGNYVGGGDLMSGYVLAMDPGNIESPLPGIESKEPVFGLSALWILDKSRDQALLAGYTVVDHSTIMATHLSETIRKHSFELIGRQELQTLVESIQKVKPKVVEELIPGLLPLGGVLKVCQNLLKEQIPIRDLTTILEALANHAGQTKDTDALTEHVRTSLARTITQKLMGDQSELEVMTFSSEVEERLIRSYQKQDQNSHLALEPGFFEKLVKQVQGSLEKTVFNSGNQVLLCHPLIRQPLKKLMDRFVPNLTIISANEIAPFTSVKSVSTVQFA